LALFAGAVIGFPLASILVAKPLRQIGKVTITDFLTYRYPHPIVKYSVATLILLSFSVYIVAQMKAAGITAEVLLGIPYNYAVTISAIVFILYVSFGGMLAVTWTDVIQGFLMLFVILATAFYFLYNFGGFSSILTQAHRSAPELGEVLNWPVSNYIGFFLIWATAIPVTPHIVMRVFTAKNPRSAQLSLNIAMIFYVLLILAAVLVIVPVGKVLIPMLKDADHIFLELMKQEFSPVVRGIAIAAVMAAVMSTTDALLLACSSAVSHDMLGDFLAKRYGDKAINRVNMAVVWVIGLIALTLSYTPPKFITTFYSLAIGLLSSSLFVPTIAGIWWKRATTLGGILSILSGAITYLTIQYTPWATKQTAILFALPVSLIAIYLGSTLGSIQHRDSA
jgi:sodium/pantothenate symporter